VSGSLYLPKIALVNRSTVLHPDDFENIAAAVTVQASRDFGPAWGITALISPMKPGEQPPADWWQLIVLDNSDQAGALGYHERTAAGQPIGYVFAETDQEYGLKVSVTTSHELLEMLADPWICAAALKQISNTAGDVYAYEVCDPVESDELGYEIAGISLSDFVLPAWFEDDASRGPYDFCNHLTAPFSLAAGGYASVFSGGWRQIQAQQTPTGRQEARVAKSGLSRTQRRFNRKG